MKKKWGKLILTLLAGIMPLYSFAFKDVPALIHLNALEQKDTIGFNLVENMSRLLYPEIIKGNVKLYNGPEKTLLISAEGLQALESSSGTSFISCPDIFVYEYWSSNRKSSAFEMVGFSFVNKNSKDEKISYGYVAFADIEILLKNNYIPNNANGFASLTYLNAWNSRRYYYHLVQLGQEAFFQNPAQAVKLKQEIFGGQKVITGQYFPTPEKKVSYHITAKKYTTDIDLSNELVTSIYTALLQNPEAYLNIAGNSDIRFPDTVFRVPKITGLYIEEFWIKDGKNARIRTARIKCLSDETELDWLYLEDLERMGVFIRFQSLLEILHSKQFVFELQAVNDQEINSEDGPMYLEAIQKSNWCRINEYIHP